MADKLMPEKKTVYRHGFSVRFVHWTVALSSLLLIFSGIGQMPVYKRYMFDRLPGMAWTSDYAITVSLHYWAAALLMLGVAYHIIFHVIRHEYDILPKRGDFKDSYLIIKAMLGKGEEPSSDKYLAEQRLAYAFIGGSLLLLIVTGVIKVIKNLPGIELSWGVVFWSTTIHNIAMLLLMVGIMAHLAAFIFKENRSLLPGIFTGKVSLEYVKNRHALWYKQIADNQKNNK